MIDQASTLASFPLTLAKQVSQSTENSLQQTRTEVEKAVESGFRSVERQQLGEATKPSAATQPSQDSNSSGQDQSGGNSTNTSTRDGKAAANSNSATSSGTDRGNVVNSVA